MNEKLRVVPLGQLLAEGRSSRTTWIWLACLELGIIAVALWKLGMWS